MKVISPIIPTIAFLSILGFGLYFVRRAWLSPRRRRLENEEHKRRLMILLENQLIEQAKIEAEKAGTEYVDSDESKLERQLKIEQELSKETITDHFDDFYPIPRSFTINREARREELFHQKLNYQYLIEKMARKMYFLFIGIVLFSSGFTYILYETSLGENISPKENVMTDYKIMMDDIVSSEGKMEMEQLKIISSLDSMFTTNSGEPLLPDSVKVKFISSIVTSTVKNEDKIVSDVSGYFFRVFYYRYIAVRLFVAFVVVLLIRYLVIMYFRISRNKHNLELKEEALSILLWLVDEIENHQRYTLLANKIPDFPLLTLFESAHDEIKKSGKGQGAQDAIYLEVLTGYGNVAKSQLETSEKITEAMSELTDALKRFKK